MSRAKEDMKKQETASGPRDCELDANQQHMWEIEQLSEKWGGRADSAQTDLVAKSTPAAAYGFRGSGALVF